jgi:hypothetical protein
LPTAAGSRAPGVLRARRGAAAVTSPDPTERSKPPGPRHLSPVLVGRAPDVPKHRPAPFTHGQPRFMPISFEQ